MSLKRLTVRSVIASAAAAAMVATVVSVGAAAPASAAPVTGGTLYFYTHSEQFPNIDPQRNYTGRDIAFFNSYVYRNLVSYKPVAGSAGSSLVGDLATNTGVPSNSAKDWTFTLRSGITWEDGSAITCADVKYGISRTFATEAYTEGPTYAIAMFKIAKLADGSSAYKGPYVKTGQDLYDKAVVCSKDGKTITFHLNRTVGDFNYAMTYPSFSPVKKSKDTGDKYDMRPFSDGPYKIQKYKINDEMILVRNAKWNKASDPFRTPYPDQIIVKFGMDEDVRDMITMKDSIPNGINMDGLQPANNIAFFENPKNASRRSNVYDPYTSYLAANNSAGHLDCLDVRKAIFFAFDNQSLINLSGGSTYYGQPGDSPVKPVLGLDYAPTTGNIHDAAWKIEGNPAEAKKYLDKAKVSCPDAYARATDPAQGISYVRTDTATSKKVAVIVKAAMDAAGIVVKFDYVPSGGYNGQLENYAKKYDLIGSGWGADWANASTVIPELWGEGCCNYTSNKDTAAYPAFIKKVNLALVELDRNKQAKMWKELAQYGMDQYWYIRTVFSKTQETWGSKVGGVFYWEPQGNFGFGALYVKP